MKTAHRIITNICSNDLPASRDFYTQLFKFEIAFDSDWYVQLTSKDQQIELGIIDMNNDLIPKAYQNAPTGFYLTFVVDSADEVYELTKGLKFEIIEKPTDMPYGQRRLLLKDPNGALIDVSSPIQGFQE